MHEKYLICDGETLLLGGRNCHDYFLGDYPARIHNIDLDVLVTGGGAVIEQLTARYQAVLARKDTLSLPAETDPKIIESCFNQLRAHAAMLSEDLPAFDYASRTAPCNQITLIASSLDPKSKAPIVWQALCDLMENAEEEVLVHTPYLICSRAMKQDLARIAQNTALRITLNSPCTSANLFGAAVYLNDKQNLLDTGADILEYHGSRSSHTKAICIDERLAVVGSFNFDMRSAYIDSELMLAIDSPELARQLKAFMEAVETQATPAGDPTVLDISPARGRMLGLLRLFERPFRHLL
ncbi:MAG: phospholipase D family protein [Clostridia bacterium]|nr:phospholipase D family protein [Clostridia bacterium]